MYTAVCVTCECAGQKSSCFPSDLLAIFESRHILVKNFFG